MSPVADPSSAPHVCQFFYVGRSEGGGEVHARTLEAAFEARGVRSRHVCVRRDPNAPPSGWLSLTDEFDDRVSRRLGPAWGVARFLARTKPTGVVCHTFAAACVVMPIAALLGVRHRVMIHHASLLRWDRFSKLLNSVDHVFGTTGLYSAIVFVSDAGIEAVPHRLARYRRRSRLIRNQVPPFVPVSRERARARFQLESGGSAWAFVGRRTLAKGADVAAAAAAAAGAVLLVAGESGDADQVIAEHRFRGTDIRLLGALTREEVVALMGACDVLIFPSRFENRPLTLLEAKSLGLPVVARDLAENRQTLDAGAVFVAGDNPNDWAKAAAEAQSKPPAEARGAAQVSSPLFSTMIDEYLDLLGARRR